jgi:TrmH family RNA methyltransferase
MSLVVLLHQPLDPINIGSVVRVCRNCEVTDLRLFEPQGWVPERVAVSAPRSEDWLREHVTVHDNWESFLAGVSWTVGVTGHERRERNRRVSFPDGLLAESSLHDTVGLMFGREDHGLLNDAADRCNALLTIPTNPDYPSMNLAQAVLVVLHTLYLSGTEATILAPAPAPHPVADGEAVERFMQTVEGALEAIDFFKGSHHDNVLRTVRRVILNARPDTQELATLWGIFRETRRLGRRVGENPAPPAAD